MIGYFLLTIMTVTTRPSTQPLTYGSDINGVVCAYWFDGTGANQPIEADQLNERLRAENLKQGFVWLHMDLNVSHAESWLKQHLSLEDEFFDSLHQGLSSTKIDQADQQLLAVMNDVRYDFNFDPSEISTLWLVADQHFMVTGRRTHLSSIDRLRRAVKRNDPFESSTDLLTHLLQDQAEVLANIIRKVTRQVDEIEDAILSSHLGQHRAKLGQLRRVMVRLARLLAPEPAALFRLLQHPPAWITPDQINGLRESTEEFSVALADMSSLQERIKLLQEEIAAQIAEANNNSIFILTIVSVLALPINLTAGLMGMNVGGVPWANNPHGFGIVVFLVLSATAFAAWLIYRKLKN
mgnify:CR=1 FL=1